MISGEFRVVEAPSDLGPAEPELLGGKNRIEGVLPLDLDEKVQGSVDILKPAESAIHFRIGELTLWTRRSLIVCAERRNTLAQCRLQDIDAAEAIDPVVDPGQSKRPDLVVGVGYARKVAIAVDPIEREIEPEVLPSGSDDRLAHRNRPGDGIPPRDRNPPAFPPNSYRRR